MMLQTLASRGQILQTPIIKKTLLESGTMMRYSAPTQTLKIKTFNQLSLICLYFCTFLLIVFDNHAMCFRFSIATDENIQDHEESIKKIRWILQWQAKRKRLNSSDVVLAFLEVISQQGSTKQAQQIQQKKEKALRSLVRQKKAYFKLTLA